MFLVVHNFEIKSNNGKYVYNNETGRVFLLPFMFDSIQIIHIIGNIFRFQKFQTDNISTSIFCIGLFYLWLKHQPIEKIIISNEIHSSAHLYTLYVKCQISSIFVYSPANCEHAQHGCHISIFLFMPSV